MKQAGFVHRDLKPENILVQQDRRSQDIIQIKIADFGLSKIVIPDELMKEGCGTAAYVAPEVLKSPKQYSSGVDMWSAGVIFYSLVCRRLPFISHDKKTTFYFIKERPPNTQDYKFRNFSKETKDIIKLMLNKDPQSRITP